MLQLTKCICSFCKRLFICLLPSQGEEWYSVTGHSDVVLGLGSLRLPMSVRHVFVPRVVGKCQMWLALLPASVSPCAVWIIIQPHLLGKWIIMTEVSVAQLRAKKVKDEGSL